MLKFFYADIRGINEDCDKTLFSRYRLEKLARIAMPDKRRQSIAAELLLIHAVKSVRPGQSLPLELSVGEWGKPELLNADFYFSLSHGDNFVACAVGDSSVGVDIQKLIDYEPRLAARFFTDDEIASVLTAEDKSLEFTRIWAMKESVLKYHGSGMRTPLKSVSVAGGRLNFAPEGFDCSLLCREIGGYVLAVASGEDLSGLEPMAVKL